MHSYDTEIDFDVVLAAGALFDFDNLIGTEAGGRLDYVPHALYGAHEALKAGLPGHVAHAIAAHTVRSRTLPETVEALVVAYGDYVDCDLVRADGTLRPLIIDQAGIVEE